MKPNLNIFERILRFALGIFFLLSAVYLFENQIAQILIGAFGAFTVVEAITARCPLVARLGVNSVGTHLSNEALYLIGLCGTQIVLAYEWWSAGFEKVSSPDFVNNIAQTLGYFASENPFPFYKNFLLGFATENAKLFAYAVEWSQVAIAIALAVSAMTILYSKSASTKKLALAISIMTLFGGALMNANFYFAAGWSSPGTHGINVVMFMTQALLIYVWKISFLKSMK